MKIVHMTEEVYGKHNPKTPEESKAIYDAVLAALNTPVELLTLKKVEYDKKSDRYSVTFSGGEKSLTLKATNEVVEFATANISNYGQWRGRLEAGVLVDVNLQQA